MLSTIGVASNLKLAHGKRTTLLPDGKGGRKEFVCQPLWVLYIPQTGVQQLLFLGFNPKHVNVKSNMKTRENSRFIKVVSVEALDGEEPSYCFNEPNNHTGVFNGIMTGQSEVY